MPPSSFAEKTACGCLLGSLAAMFLAYFAFFYLYQILSRPDLYGQPRRKPREKEMRVRRP